MKKHINPILTGTFILTCAGMITRLLGFYYRIFLTKLFGEEGMGIYQLITPVLSISFSLTAAGFQTALSKIIAEYYSPNLKFDSSPLKYCLTISTILSLIAAFIIYYGGDYIGTVLFHEPRTIPLIKILAFSVPFSSIHSCLNGYFYGKQKVQIPAFTQLAEQLVRVSSVYILSLSYIKVSDKPPLYIAALGLTIGEIASLIITLYPYLNDKISSKRLPKSPKVSHEYIRSQIVGMVIPVTSTRIVLNLLQSAEAVAIPTRLKMFGLDSKSALSIYGVVTGMVLPLIFFPNAITASLSVILLPNISKHQACGNTKTLRKNITLSIKYSFWLGFICSMIFFIFADKIGFILFKSSIVGHFLRILGFICPFLYLNTTLSSILQGLGKAGYIFIINCSCMLIRLIFVYLLIPQFGIKAYLWGMLTGQLIQCICYITYLYNYLVHENK